MQPAVLLYGNLGKGQQAGALLRVQPIPTAVGAALRCHAGLPAFSRKGSADANDDAQSDAAVAPIHAAFVATQILAGSQPSYNAARLRCK